MRLLADECTSGSIVTALRESDWSKPEINALITNEFFFLRHASGITGIHSLCGLTEL